MKVRSKIIVSLAIRIVAIFMAAFVVCPHLVFDLVFCDSYGLKGDVRQLERSHEKLPTVSINGDTAYCRMYACDFSFPLPSNARIVQTNIDEGGFDTINGTIYFVSSDGSPVNMRAYAELLQKKNFDTEPCDGSGCPEVTNNAPDVPFMSNGRAIHYPLFNDFTVSSKSPEGGFMEVSLETHMAKIRFSYFGDY